VRLVEWPKKLKNPKAAHLNVSTAEELSFVKSPMEKVLLMFVPMSDVEQVMMVNPPKVILKFRSPFEGEELSIGDTVLVCEIPQGVAFYNNAKEMFVAGPDYDKLFEHIERGMQERVNVFKLLYSEKLDKAYELRYTDDRGFFYFDPKESQVACLTFEDISELQEVKETIKPKSKPKLKLKLLLFILLCLMIHFGIRLF